MLTGSAADRTAALARFKATGGPEQVRHMLVMMMTI